MPSPDAATTPCPKGDDCALNSGAVHCKHCGRNWPPDKTWERPAATEPDYVTAGIGYTIATGRLFTRMDEFHAFAEKVLGRPILTHEFADEATWHELRSEFEKEVRGNV